MRTPSETADTPLRDVPDPDADHFFDPTAKPAPDSPSPDPTRAPPGAVVVDDAHLLFSGQFSKSGVDLVVSGDGRSFVIHDYFRGQDHAPLYTADGASLSGPVVDALVGHTAYAQAAPAPSPGNPIGHVAKLTGSASVIRNGVTVELNVNDNVFKGDVVQAGSASVLGISFIDGTAFSLGANARMMLNEMVYDPNGSSNSSFLSLIQGAITFIAGQTAKNGSMKIDTPVATMGIRGTAVLVEIAANNGPTRFSLLIEPGNHVGSYVLYHKTSGQPLGNVSQAGMMTIVTPAGFNQFSMTQQAKTLADISAVQDIIQQVFSIAFPKVNDVTPKSRFGSVGSGTTPSGDLHFGAIPIIGAPELVKLLAAGSGPNLRLQVDDLFVPQKTINTPPTIVITNASAFQFGGVGNVETTQSPIPGDRTFSIADHVTIIDPDAGAPPFFDLPQPYVPGTAQIAGVSGPPLPQGVELSALISIDPATGVVTYDPSLFRFLGQGEKIVYTISFDSKSGPDTFHETLLFTINGLDDAPEFGSAQTTASLVETAHRTGSSTPLAATFVLPFSDLDFSDIASGYTVTILNVVASGVTSGLPQAAADREAALRSFLSQQGLTKNFGATAGTLTETFSAPDKTFDYLAAGETLTLTYTIRVTDAHGAADTETLTITVTGTNDQASIGTPSHASVTQDQNVDAHGNLIAPGSIPISDPDTGQAAFQTTVTAAGCDLGSLTLNPDGSYVYTVANSAAQYLGQGETRTDTFTVTSVDGTTRNVAFVIHGVNDAPVLDTHGASPTFVAGHQPVVIDPCLTISDIDSTHLTGATVAITGHYQAGEDYLRFCDTTFSDGGRIAGTFDCATGTLTLTGTASVADYQAALASVTYFNAKHDACDDVRIVSFSVTDGSAINGTSNIGTVTITIDDDRPKNAADSISTPTPATVQARDGDTFVFGRGSGHDTIVDVQHGVDRIELNYFAPPAGTSQSDWFTQWAASGAVAHSGFDTLIDLNPNDLTRHDTIHLRNVAHLSANDFIVHPGNTT